VNRGTAAGIVVHAVPRITAGSASYRPRRDRGKGYQRGPKRQRPVTIQRVMVMMANGSNESSGRAPAATGQEDGSGG
jgi:hypothetical protein